MGQRKYYEAYDERYQTAHQQNIRWFGGESSPIVSEILEKYQIRPRMSLLELGCGEGRDAQALLRRGYDLLATDISREAIQYCKNLCPEYTDRFQQLDCVCGSLEGRFDFIYGVAVVHMLLLDEDRDGFYRFISRHLTEGGIGLICSMGDGTVERCSDINTAFQLQEREAEGKTLWVAGTSCRMASFPTFEAEITRNGLEILETGMTSIPLHFSHMMYAVVKGAEGSRCE